MQVGVVFFSDGSIALTRPHDDIKTIAEDLRYLTLEPLLDDGFGKSQLALFSNGTQTAPALLFAGKIIEEMDLQRISQTSAIVLVSDLQDDTSLLVQTFNKLIQDGHNIYVLAAARQQEINAILSNMSSDRIKIFSIASEKDMQEAYTRISGLEQERISRTLIQRRQESESVLWPAFLLFGLLSAFLFTAEVFFRRARKEW